jgi:nucleotide-binding universal stress UspA family protein
MAAESTVAAVVVAVSPTSGSPSALRWGAAEAARRQSPLVAISAWRTPRAPISTGARPPVSSVDPESSLAEARAELAAQVREALGEDAEVKTEVVRGSTFRVLLQASETADLLVLDAPRRIEFPEAPMLAHRLIYSAECPVVIMPPATLH